MALAPADPGTDGRQAEEITEELRRDRFQQFGGRRQTEHGHLGS